MKYWLRTSEGFFGPFSSRRKASRFARRAKTIAKRVTGRGCRCTESEFYASLSKFRVRRGKDIVNATFEQVRRWEECMAIDQSMLQNAY